MLTSVFCGRRWCEVKGRQWIALPLSFELGNFPLAASPPQTFSIQIRVAQLLEYKDQFLEHACIWVYRYWLWSGWDSPGNYGGVWKHASWGFSEAGDNTLGSGSRCHPRQGFSRMDGKVVAVKLSHPVPCNLVVLLSQGAPSPFLGLSF